MVTKSKVFARGGTRQVAVALAVACMVTAGNVPGVAWARDEGPLTVQSTASCTRYGGANRYETMRSMVAGSFDHSNWAVVATGENFPDALAASALAGVKDCPVILTQSDGLSARAKDLLQELGVKHTYLMGGKTALGEVVARDIKGLGVSVERVAGDDRAATSVAAMDMARRNGSVGDTVVVATGDAFADALSIGPWAYKMHAPVLLTRGDGMLSSLAIDALSENTGIKRAIIVGGEAVVSKAVETQLSSCGYAVKRLAGANRYETSKVIAEWEAENGLGWDGLAVATGQNFPDALAGSAFCGVRDSVLLLASKPTDVTIGLIRSYAKDVSLAEVLGGETAIPESLCDVVYDAANKGECSFALSKAKFVMPRLWQDHVVVTRDEGSGTNGYTFKVDGLPEYVLCSVRQGDVSFVDDSDDFKPMGTHKLYTGNTVEVAERNDGYYHGKVTDQKGNACYIQVRVSPHWGSTSAKLTPMDQFLSCQMDAGDSHKASTLSGIAEECLLGCAARVVFE